MSNPWDRWRHPFTQQGLVPPSQASTMKPFTATAVHGPDENAQKQASQNQVPVKVDLPDHLFIPRDAQSFDGRRVALIAPATVNFPFWSFQCPLGATLHFLQYSIFSDGTLAANQEFIPRVDGNRVFPYHGDPNNNFRMDLGLGPDMSNANTIQCQLTLNPNETLTWFLTNTNAVAVAMGVRMIGYIDYTQRRLNQRSGG